MWGCALSAVKSRGERGAREITFLVRQRRARELIKPAWLHCAGKHREISHTGNGAPSCRLCALRAVRKQKGSQRSFSVKRSDRLEGNMVQQNPSPQTEACLPTALSPRTEKS